MKKWFAILIILVAVFSFAFVPSNASAQISQGFHEVNVTFAGPLFNRIVIIVDAVDQSFTDKWLELNVDNDKALLATALTLMTAGVPGKVWVANDPHTLAGLPVQTCFSVLFAAP